MNGKNIGKYDIIQYTPITLYYKMKYIFYFYYAIIANVIIIVLLLFINNKNDNLHLETRELSERIEVHEKTLKDLSKANKRIKELEKIRDKYYHECLLENNYEAFRNNQQE